VISGDAIMFCVTISLIAMSCIKDYNIIDIQYGFSREPSRAVLFYSCRWCFLLRSWCLLRFKSTGGCGMHQSRESLLLSWLSYTKLIIYYVMYTESANCKCIISYYIILLYCIYCYYLCIDCRSHSTLTNSYFPPRVLYYVHTRLLAIIIYNLC